jgi:DNA-binding IscR family transcriptional regulator
MHWHDRISGKNKPLLRKLRQRGILEGRRGWGGGEVMEKFGTYVRMTTI